MFKNCSTCSTFNPMRWSSYFQNFTTINPSDWLPGVLITGELTVKDYMKICQSISSGLMKKLSLKISCHCPFKSHNIESGDSKWSQKIASGLLDQLSDSLYIIKGKIFSDSVLVQYLVWCIPQKIENMLAKLLRPIIL